MQVALMEGMALAKTIVLNEPTKPEYDAVASAVFSHPELATVVSGAELLILDAHASWSRRRRIVTWF